MTNREFSDTFTTMLNSYSVKAQFGDQSSMREIVLDEYEKSVFLTLAQEEVVMNLYNGKNIYGDSFESTEELRRQLNTLVKTKTYTSGESVEGVGVSNNSIFFHLPDDLAFITLEQVTFNDKNLGCGDGTIANVQPVKQDEYNKIKDNPFRGATKYKALRLDSGNDMVEIISKYTIGKYLIRYMSKLTPIILEDLPNGLAIGGISEETPCALNSILHKAILERAVLMALQSKGINTGR